MDSPRNAPLPTVHDVDRLCAYLPRLDEAGFEPVLRWHGRNPDGSLTLPYPDYHPLVEEFFMEAARPCWLDRRYRPAVAGRMLDDHDQVAHASLAEVRTMLTFCMRGEHFAEGHWEEMIVEGHVRRLLLRLRELRAGMS